MKKNQDCLDIVERLDKRMDGIENMLKLLLVHHLIDQLPIATGDFSNSSSGTIDLSVFEIIKHYQLLVGDVRYEAGIKILEILIPKNVKVKSNDLKLILKMVKDTESDILPLFLYETINGMQRKSLMADKVSFATDKELHIYGLRRNTK